MPYFVTPITRNHQVSLDEILRGITDLSVFRQTSTPFTRTYDLSVGGSAYWHTRSLYSPSRLISLLQAFNKEFASLIDCDDKQHLYNTFYIPKRSGSNKWRRIDAPNDELDYAIRQLKHIFETEFNTLCHTSAHAYVKGRSTITAVKVHQRHKSRWFLKLDFTDFFGSITLDFAMKQLSRIIPYSFLCARADGYQALKQALSICFLRGGLPQGTAISPLLTNLIMIPLDYHFANICRSGWDDYKLAYTRYADDITISCPVSFDYQRVKNYIEEYLQDMGTPIRLNPKKTRYVSANGQNYMLGLMYNKDLEITIGANKKRQLKAAVTSYLLDRKNGSRWSLEDVQILNGQISYYLSVEPDNINDIINKLSAKFGADFRALIKEDLQNPS